MWAGGGLPGCLPRAGGAAWPLELVCTRLATALDAHAYADGGDTRATRVLAELVRMLPKDGWCGGADVNGEDKMSLFLFFGETVYANEGSRGL